MGQKVNPNGLRVGVIDDWSSHWYADKNTFSECLVEDQKIREFVLKAVEPIARGNNITNVGRSDPQPPRSAQWDACLSKNLGAMAKVFISKAAAQAVAAVAVFAFELDEGLAVASGLCLQAALLPHVDDVVLLRLQLFQQVEGAVAELFLLAVATNGEEHGDRGVDDDDVERFLRQVFLAVGARGTEGVVGLPVGRDVGGQQLVQLLHRLALQQFAQPGAPLVVEAGQLGDAYVWEVLRP